MGYGLWSCKESDVTKQLTCAHIQWFPNLNPFDLTVSQSLKLANISLWTLPESERKEEGRSVHVRFLKSVLSSLTN